MNRRFSKITSSFANAHVAAKAAGALIVYDITNRRWAMVQIGTAMQKSFRCDGHSNSLALGFVWTMFTVVFRSSLVLLHVCLSSIAKELPVYLWILWLCLFKLILGILMLVTYDLSYHQKSTECSPDRASSQVIPTITW